MKRIINSENYKFERNASSLSPSSRGSLNASAASSSSSSSTTTTANKYRVSRSREKIRLTQKYRILNAYDPHTGRVFSLGEIVSLNLINKYTSSFLVPSTGQLIALDDAIQLGYVRAQLIDEFLETSNESYEFTHNDDGGDGSNSTSLNSLLKAAQSASLLRDENLSKASLSSINTIIKVARFYLSLS